MKGTECYNFSAGPAALPKEVMKQIQAEWLDYQHSGTSIIEKSHRGVDFSEVLKTAKDNIRELLNIPNDYEVLFAHGGASMQFAMLPMNFLPKNGIADYINTGRWAQRAVHEANLFGKVNLAASSENNQFRNVPTEQEWQVSSNAAYLHYTSNNTVYGTQFPSVPNRSGLPPLVVDMSSDIMSYPFDVKKFSLIYAGLQKNLGPSATAMVIVKKDFLAKQVRQTPGLLCYKTLVENDSMFNTPNTFAIYVLGLITEWLKQEGGLSVIQQKNEIKSSLLYRTIDESGGFYQGFAEHGSRSRMNVCFSLPSLKLTHSFVKKAETNQLLGLAGHRSVGGIRASLYNAMSVEGVEKLVRFMMAFKKENCIV
jgi:phosphoserine aminotransferase